MSSVMGLSVMKDKYVYFFFQLGRLLTKGGFVDVLILFLLIIPALYWTFPCSSGFIYLHSIQGC